MKANVIVFGILTALFATIIVSGCITLEQNGGVEFKEMPRFESYDAMAAAFKEAQSTQRGFGILETVTTPMMAKSLGAMEDAGAGVDYSRTNIQVEGVDEADIVKSDGKFIYNFSKGRLIITDAFPIETAGIVSKTELQGLQPLEMFVSGNKLLLFASKFEQGSYDGSIGIAEERIAYPYYGSSRVAVQLYNVSDKSSPVLEKELEFEGSYLTSRLIGENAFFVVNSWPHYWVLEEDQNADGESIIPLMVEDGVEKRIAEATEIAFLPPMPPESFVTIASVNLNSGSLEKEVIAGSAESVFASLDNFYLASTVWMASETPVVKEVERAIVGDSENTVINKFNLSNGKINFVGQGSVKGHVLNQFSMDEFNGNFRIATTFFQGNFGQSSNNLYVLNERMETIGFLEGLAPGESIYSARFLGSKAFLVTFKKVDPLFVIDLSSPENPKVLGKLKIPGYSDYLHPIDETHLIGVGKETTESSYGDFAWYQGLKMAVFDVSDVENPIELHKIVIGDRGTDSFALQDHKAFLYDKEKELLVLPIMLAVIPAEQKSQPLIEGTDFPGYGEPVFQGAFVFRLTLESGFEEKGRITHASAEDELKRGYYFGDDYSVKRALYIDNVLYTLSERMLKANALDSLQELKEFVFE